MIKKSFVYCLTLLVFLGMQVDAKEGLHSKGLNVPIIPKDGEHFLNGKSRDGKIQLEDGTVLKAIKEDQAKVFDRWEYNEHICFSPYPYPNPYPLEKTEFYVLNITRNEFVHANLYCSPNSDSPHTQRIFYIDPFDGQIALRTNNDEEKNWEVEKKDLEVLKKWEKGDRVIIGMNDNWFAMFLSGCKYIMVNCEKDNHGSYVRIKPFEPLK